ncbi:stalk domain-containing protein [Helicovermis profundi]|uniref:Transglutaminase-like domain-containing protein n=1 Tax=Helicovermis profundi TaxID=3065157 RepID=A0AAU9EYT9_9FIRM|nr:hypothetical protein HLPR_25910 [Clostridia bacterium S502]
MKRFLILIIFIIAYFSCFSFADENNSISSKKEIQMFLNDKEISLNVSPIIVNDTVLVPMRSYFEALGSEIRWIGRTKEVSAYKNNMFIKLKIDSDEAYKNGKKFKLDSAPIIVNSHTMVPAKFIADTFDLNLVWDKDASTITLSSKNNGENYNFVNDNFYKKISIDDIGAYFYIPQQWKLIDFDNKIYGLKSNDEESSVQISKTKISPDETLESLTEKYKTSVYKTNKDTVVFTGNSKININEIESTVTYYTITENDSTIKSIIYLLIKDNYEYKLIFSYKTIFSEDNLIDQITYIAKSFQLSKYTINYDDEHYVELPSFDKLGIDIENEIYSNMEVKSSFNFKATIEQSDLSKLEVIVSRKMSKKSFIIPIIDGKINSVIYTPFGLGKHNILIKTPDTITKDNQVIKGDPLLVFSVVNLDIKKLEYLVPSTKIQNNELGINSLSNLLTYNKLKTYDKSKAIFTWISSNISINQIVNDDYDSKPSLQVYNDEYGTPEEICYFYTALLRAINIPSRTVYGINDTNSKYFWVEMYINGKWVASDILATIKFSSNNNQFFYIPLNDYRENFKEFHIEDY